MNFTFLIGNGFDLNLHLPTNYSDFYAYLNRQPTDTLSEDLKTIIHDINVNGEYWSDMEIALGDYPERHKIESPDVFLDQSTALSNALRDYLQIVQQHYALEMISSTNGNEFHYHLLHFYDDLSEEQKQWIVDLKKRSPNHIVYQFINYNYTCYLDDIVKWAGVKTILENRDVKGTNYQTRINKPLHIHGTLEDGQIVGVDNADQIHGISEVVNKVAPYFIKSELNNSLGTLNNQKAIKIINDSRIVCIYGMSFGLTDLMWWKCIWDWLKSLEDNRLIIFTYAQGKTISTAIDKARYWDDVRNLFFDRVMASEEERTKYASRIFVCEKSRVFTFENIKVVKKDGQN